MRITLYQLFSDDVFLRLMQQYIEIYASIIVNIFGHFPLLFVQTFQISKFQEFT